jgi:diguanylate cyclase (GGDEF)-like protein
MNRPFALSASGASLHQESRADGQLRNQKPEERYFSDLVEKSTVDLISVILRDGVTDIALKRFVIHDWINQWTDNCRQLAEKAVDECFANGCSRAKLHALRSDQSVRCYDVVLTRSGDGLAAVSVARDITEEIATQDSLRRVAFHDGLTGLLNRMALRDRLETDIDRLIGTDGTIAVFMIDLDNFKFINDTLGHDAGDSLLKEAANRLSSQSPTSATVARLGGDEFVIIVPADRGRPDVFGISERLLEAMQKPVEYRGRVLTTQASIGVAMFPKHGSSASELLKNADIALYAAKAFGRGGFSTYVPSMGSSLLKRASSLDAVRDALKYHRMEAYYQPKIALGSKIIEGFEAIPRLRFENGLLIPDGVIRQAMDDIDVARQVGDRMFDRVTENVRAWLEAGIEVSHVALNTSAADFRAGDFAKRFLERLQRSELNAELFEIEVSETVLAGRNTDYVATALADLADAGVRVALDDFGTGASSIVQLKHMPFDSIKIDQSIVHSLATDNRDEAIVKAMIGFADGLGIRTAAVGIQSIEQLETLQSMGCQSGQGDLWGQPVSASDIPTTIATVMN